VDDLTDEVVVEDGENEMVVVAEIVVVVAVMTGKVVTIVEDVIIGTVEMTEEEVDLEAVVCLHV
jgi:hypothetical protein